MRVAAAMALILVLSFPRLLGQPAPAGAKLAVDLRNVTEQHSYRLKDSVVLDFEIINSGSQTVGVFAKLGMGYQGGVILHVLNDTGTEIEPPTLEHDFLDTDAMQDARNYFELPPHQFFGTRQEFAVAELVSKPGLYKLLAEYRCPVDARFGKVGNFWSVEHRSVISNKIALKVE